MVEKLEKIWMDGRFVDWDDANIHILTHTLHYGLGAFEGIRCYLCDDGSSAIFKLKEHVDRFFNSAHIGQIDIPFSKEEITNAIIETVKINGLKESYIRPIVFIGDGAMGIHPQNNPIRVAIAVWQWGAYLGDEGLKNGIRVKTSSFTRHHVNIMMTKAKICGNYVNSVLAKREVTQDGYDEAVILDPEGYVCEATGENIFIIHKGDLKTPPLTSVLPGITRASVISIALDRGIRVIEERFTRDELYVADEAFFTGTAAEITPIREVDNRSIGNGKPGEITQTLQNIFFDIIRGKQEKYKKWLTYI
ncbi:MAG: branched chain amino acid aminotransferase [Deltaproteobacteria bacterium CG_4_8_14_3_um_filter_43_13]|nr:MAG: branched chain amino acid aminotransferase [Deltaproteobacteria bacterium CG2_30_43_15]PIU86524.1 MAG: branched chain amino acid aminotransferase [Deltaproteobacteria bacterium CG06_land_8_20_14_3_00_44_19]PIX22614.1 MAG: branched chain amino acid aminotransferase [Deltaproteobacteria bacterium CG_4_8_14_3_um_filter_43_13]PIZ19354.1 MAG: branched chain amino acid aminotransferase [Deltaproteobacteria bacterium CG_4_10_14_0_8_um_filter_43_12]HCX89288.1 branched chain amino acid aminotran